jgi:hypothetical protein
MIAESVLGIDFTFIIAKALERNALEYALERSSEIRTDIEGTPSEPLPRVILGNRLKVKYAIIEFLRFRKKGLDSPC